MSAIDNTCISTQINISELTSLVRIDIDSDYFSKNVRTFSWYDTSKIILDVTSAGEGDALLMDIYAERLSRNGDLGSLSHLPTELIGNDFFTRFSPHYVQGGVRTRETYVIRT